MVAFNKAASRLLRLGGIILAISLLIHLGFRVKAFVHIFFEHAGMLVNQEEVLRAYSLGHTSSPVVPRITHQIFHNWTHPGEETLPEDWNATRQTCLDTNPEWVHHLWTDRSSKEFMEKEYPWFLPTYKRFKFPVQKIDALRYFLMRHYGGIYIDLDNGCLTDLEPLRGYPAWTTDGGHGALSNNILGVEPNHLYWIAMTDSIISHAWNYPLPYLTISYATGQWFLTKTWEEYHKNLPLSEQVLTRVLMDGREGAPRWVFFNHTRGGTWDNWDNRMFPWIGDHLGMVALSVAILCLICGLAISSCFSTLRKRNKKIGYEKVQSTH